MGEDRKKGTRHIMQRSILRALLLGFVVVTALGGLSACNTMAGAGQDIQQGGKALENSADHNK